MGIGQDLRMQYRTGDLTTKLIFFNIAVFVLSIVLFYKFRAAAFDYPTWIALSSDPLTVATRPWTLLIYSFFHGGFFHLLFNLIILNFAGRLFLTFFNERQMLGLYLTSAIFAGLCYMGGYYLLGRESIIVGASGAIMAILMGAATYAPNMDIRLLLIGRIKLWHFAAAVILIDLLYILAENTGGHIAHLAGAFFGYIYVEQVKRGRDLGSWLASAFGWAAGLAPKTKKTPFRKVHRTTKAPAVKPSGKNVQQKRIDEILDKISKSGYDSLSAEEKEFLFRAGKE